MQQPYRLLSSRNSRLQRTASLQHKPAGRRHLHPVRSVTVPEGWGDFDALTQQLEVSRQTCQLQESAIACWLTTEAGISHELGTHNHQPLEHVQVLAEKVGELLQGASLYLVGMMGRSEWPPVLEAVLPKSFASVHSLVQKLRMPEPHMHCTCQGLNLRSPKASWARVDKALIMQRQEQDGQGPVQLPPVPFPGHRRND